MRFRTAFIACLTAFCAPILASANDQLVVHIECTAEGKPTSTGSGVIISPDGHVLTAKHVVPDGYNCTGGIGSINGLRLPLSAQERSANFDAMVLKFDAGLPNYATFCALSPDMRGRDIRVLAFHSGTVNEPSEEPGIISSTSLDEQGMFETSAKSVGGKSGGPAFLKGTNSLIGIVGGGAYNATGEKIDMLTPVDKLTDIAPLIKATSCAPKIDGYTVEQHQAILDKRLAELRADLDRASTAEKQVLQLQLDAVLRDLADLDASYKAREEELTKLRQQLAELNEGQVSPERLEEAQTALYRGETRLADEIFAEIEEADAAAVKRVAAAAYGRGIIARDEVRWAEAYTHFEKAARLDPSVPHLIAAQSMSTSVGKLTESQLLGEKLIAAIAEASGTNSEEYAGALNLQSITLKFDGQFDASEALAKQALDIVKENFPDTRFHANALNNIAVLQETRGQFDAAVTTYRQSATIIEGLINAADVKERAALQNMLASGMNNLGHVLINLEHFDEAEKVLLETLDLSKHGVGEDHPDHIPRLNNYAVLLGKTGRHKQAVEPLKKVSELTEKTLGTQHFRYAIALNNLAFSHQNAGEFDEAEAIFRRAMEIGVSVLGRDHPENAMRMFNLGYLLTLRDSQDEGKELIEEALALFEAEFGADHPDTKQAKGIYRRLFGK